jgi:serine/threonine protein phosphatase PrpC
VACRADVFAGSRACIRGSWQAEQSAQEMSQKLMQAALDNGGKDNITVMVVRWS